jgi:hypothetical protein
VSRRELSTPDAHLERPSLSGGLSKGLSMSQRHARRQRWRTKLAAALRSGASLSPRAPTRGGSSRSTPGPICSGRSSRSKKRRRNWAASHSMFHCASATNSRCDAGRIESVTYSGGAGSSGRTTPLKMNPTEMFAGTEIPLCSRRSREETRRRGATPALLSMSTRVGPTLAV